MAGGQEAVFRAKEGVEDVQTKRELGQTHSELGRIAFELVEAGEIAHARLDESVAKIRELNARAKSDSPSADGDGDGAGASSAPPAMPT